MFTCSIICYKLVTSFYLQVLIHIADAPCHGLEYHDSSVGDSRPVGDPSNSPNLYYFGYIMKEATDKIISVFDGILCKLSGVSSYICI